MKRVNYVDIKSQIRKLVSKSIFSEVYLLNNGKYLKVFTPFFLAFASKGRFSIEDKINSAKSIDTVPEVLIPNSSVYNNGRFIGYIIDSANGISYTDRFNKLCSRNKDNLRNCTDLYLGVEKAVVRANNGGIIFPDLLTCDNIFIDSAGNIQFIDYDGIQLGDYYTYTMSTVLGNQAQYETSKYKDINGFYLPNLDKKSLIYLYFSTIFCVNLDSVGKYNPYTGRNITLEEILNLLGIDDPDFSHKVWLAVCDKQRDNEYLGDTILGFPDRYNLEILDGVQGKCTKKLVKK